MQDLNSKFKNLLNRHSSSTEIKVVKVGQTPTDSLRANNYCMYTDLLDRDQTGPELDELF